MSSERMSDEGRPKETPVDPERARVAEEVFRKYHKDLIHWCEYKIIKQYPRLNSFNTKSDAEEIVAYVYERLLRDTNSIDLNRSEPEIIRYLNVALDYAINSYIKKTKEKMRIPQENLIPIEDVEENDLPTQEFVESLSDKDTKKTIEIALIELERKDAKAASIIRERYKLGKTMQEVANSYGITRQAIEQREKKALEKLKKLINKNNSLDRGKKLITEEGSLIQEEKENPIEHAIEYLEHDSIFLMGMPENILNPIEREALILSIEGYYSPSYVWEVLKRKGHSLPLISPDANRNKVIPEIICKMVKTAIEKAKSYVNAEKIKDFNKRTNDFLRAFRGFLN